MKKLFASIILLFVSAVGVSAATPILGTNVATIDQMYNFVRTQNSSFDREIAVQFYVVSQVYGLRGDIALCQSIVETGWFKYTGGTAVTPDDHNYCGLGVTVFGEKGCQFKTVKEGVTAQIQHLYAYACTKAIPAGEALVDPRFTYVKRGCAPNWEDLGGKWATSSSYGTKILNLYNQMMSSVPATPSAISASPSSVSLSGVCGQTKPYAMVKITATSLSSAMKYNSSSSAFAVEPQSDWNSMTGGTLKISLDTSKSAGTYSGYIAVQSGTGDNISRIEISCSGTLTSSGTTTPDQPTDPGEGDDDEELGDDNLSVNVSKITMTGVHKSSNQPYVDVVVKGSGLTSDISVNSNTGVVTVAKLSDWNARTGGTLRVTLNTNFSLGAGTYTTGYVAIQSTSAHRIELPLNVTLLPEGSAEPSQPSHPSTPDAGLGDDYLKTNKSKVTLEGVYKSTIQPYVDVLVTGNNLTADISVNSISSVVTVTKLSGWNARTGGTLRVTLNTNFSLGAGTYTTGYVAIQSTSAHRIELPLNVTLLPEGAGIGDVTVDENSEYPVEWYNLQGVKADGENLAPGLYIRRQGREVKKIIVK